MMTPAQRQKAKVSRQLKAKKKNNIKRKEAEECSKLEVDFERLKYKHKSMSQKNKSISEEHRTQFLETPNGVAGIAGSGVGSIFKERSNQAGCSAC